MSSHAAEQRRGDREAVVEVLRRYAEAIDARDREGVRALFTADARLDYRSSDGPRGPRDEVVDWLLDALAGVTLTQHLLANHRVRIDGDRATCTTAMLNPLVLADAAAGEATVLLFGGRYDDELVRTDDGWRISDRVHVVDWQAGPMPGRLLGPAPPADDPSTEQR